MKTTRIFYWVSTGLVALGMAMSGVMYLSKADMLVEGFSKVGLPLFLLPFLGLAKLLGAIALFIPKQPKLTEWAYAGFTFTFLGAVWTHLSTGTPFVSPLVFLAVLATSYLLKRKLQQQ